MVDNLPFESGTSPALRGEGNHAALSPSEAVDSGGKRGPVPLSGPPP